MLPDVLMIKFLSLFFPLLTSSSMSMIGVCLLAGVMQRLSMISTLMKSKTYFLAGWFVSDVLEPTLQYSDWLRFIPESAAKALNSSVGDPASSSKSLTWDRMKTVYHQFKLFTKAEQFPGDDLLQRRFKLETLCTRHSAGATLLLNCLKTLFLQRETAVIKVSMVSKKH